MAMSDQIGRFSASRKAAVEKIKPPEPAKYLNAAACETTVQIGVFFDGTGNNRDLDQGKFAHSNVARLWQTYPHRPEKGSFAIYIPGLGTPFPEVGEDTETMAGGSFAEGGDSRIVFALLRVFNAIHRILFPGTVVFNSKLIKALCQHASPSSDEGAELKRVGLVASLVSDDDGARRNRFLSLCAEDIRSRSQAKQVPKIRECVLDVFGFSRGATEARVFCHWFADLLSDRKLAKIPCRYRFLGLMDTVASVGAWEGFKNGAYKTGGHSNWATVDSLRIRPEVENCVHLVAMHELRKSFPLDSVSINGVLPPNCIEFAYPGAHSDVGGGYRPGALGVACSQNPHDGDSLKISQIPLNHMFDFAVAAGVPLSRQGKGTALAADFSVHEAVQQAFNKFFDICSETPRSLGEWALPYLVWRWQVRLSYERTAQVTKSSSEDRSYLLASNQQFREGDEQLQQAPMPWYKDASRASNGHRYERLEPEAPKLHAQVIAQGMVVPELAEFFDGFVHDSMAGFRKKYIEPTGYWRYRRVFQGSEVPVAG